MLKRYRLKHVLETLGFTSITIPLFQRIEMTPSGGFSIIIRIHLGTSPSRVVKKLEHIAVGMNQEEVTMTRVSRNKFRLLFRNRNQDIFPEYPKENVLSDTPQQISSIPFGVNADGYQVRLPIFNSSGGTVNLIGGIPGQGKSSALKLIVSGFANSNTCIIWFDPKSGDASEYQARVNVYKDPINPEGYLSTLKSLNKTALRRNFITSQGVSILPLPKIILMVDEWFLFSSSFGDKATQNEIQMELRKIVAIGRSANISVILATQRPTSQNIDITTRELSNTRIAFYCGDIHASEAILGQPGAEDKTNPLKPGEALIWLDGLLQRTSLYGVPDPQINVNRFAGLKQSPEDLAHWEEIYCHEFKISLPDELKT